MYTLIHQFHSTLASWFVAAPRRRASSRRHGSQSIDGDGRIAIERLEDRTLLSAISFQAISLQDQFNDLSSGSIPPDTMGAIGPDHFVEIINSSVAIYDKSDGSRLSHVSLTSFFTGDGVTPANGTFDPRVLFDRASGRWFATAMERGAVSGEDNDVILAVSDTSDPTGDWDRYVIPVGEATDSGTSYFTDYSTLGVDENGVYFGMRIFPSTGGSYAKIAATPIAPLLAATPSLGTVTMWSNISDMYSSPQPAHNQDDIGASDAAWFVSSSTSFFHDVNYRTLTWSGGTPTLSSTSVLTTSDSYANPINAPASGSTTNVNVGDDRLQMAVIRNHSLWTARTIGLNSSGTASGADRTGIEWFELNVTTTTPSVIQTGRIFDSAASDPRFYYYPSIMVNGQGHARIGYSGSKSSEFVGAYSSERLASDTLGTMSAPTLIKAGEASYTRLDGSGRNRWGDYSYTSLDPNDDMTLWTLQQYAESGTNIWGTWVDSHLSPAPTLNDPGASGLQGATSVTVNLTGTGIYDPGAGFANRLNVQLTGGAINGISNYQITFNSSTSATVTFDIAANASAGTRDIVLTNPDGQSVTIVNGFTVNASSSPPVIGSFGGDIAYKTGGAAQLLSPTATITDVDSTDFNTGALTVQITANGQASDLLSIRSTSGGNFINVSGSNVRVGTLVIGTFTGGTGTTALVITLNANATVGRTQMLLRNIQYQNTSGSPSTLARTVQVTLSDGDGSTSTPVSKLININAPVIGSFGSDIAYTTGGAAQLLSPTATITDVDSTDFNTGVLTVQITGNGQASDLLSIRSTAGGNFINVSGSNVRVGTLVIGTFTGGTGTSALVVTLNANATVGRTQMLLRNIQYRNTSGSPSTLARTVQVTLSDGDGSTSMPVSKLININAPVIGSFGGNISYTTGGAAQLLSPTATITDVDSTDFNTGVLTVQITANGQGSDLLSIRSTAGGNFINVSGSIVRVGTLVIGTFTGGNGTTALVITLNANATVGRTQMLLRNIQYRNTSGSPSTLARTVQVTLSDGDGSTSLPVSKLINIA